MVIIVKGEATEAELTRLIQKRAAVEDPEALDELWEASARRHHEQIRRQNRWEWVRYFDRMATNHARLAADYERRAEELCEEGARAAAATMWCCVASLSLTLLRNGK